jgi:NADH-quinone oxidoreductase subunit K
MHVGLIHYLVTSAVVFALGSAIVMMRRNVVAVLMGVELILNSAALNFVAFARFAPVRALDASVPRLGAEAASTWSGAVSGQLVALFIIVAAAAEAAVALAIILNFFNRYGTVHLDDGSELKE